MKKLLSLHEFVSENLANKNVGFLHTMDSRKSLKESTPPVKQETTKSFEELQEFEQQMFEKLKRATNWVLFKHPYYSKFMIHAGMYLTTSKKYRTACTDGIDIWFNVNFVNEHTINELRGVIIHELLHIILLHCVKTGRAKGKVHDMWNRACDYALNWIIKEDEYYGKEIDLPSGVLLDEKYGGLTAEEIYEDLKNQPQPPSKPQKGKGDPQDGGEGDGEPGDHWDDVLDPDDPDGVPDDSESTPIKKAMDEDGEEIERGSSPQEGDGEGDKEGEGDDKEGEGDEKEGKDGKPKPGGKDGKEGDKNKDAEKKPEEVPTVGGYVVGPDGGIYKVTSVSANGDVEVAKVGQAEQERLMRGKNI